MNSNLVFWFYAYGITVLALFFAMRGVKKAKHGRLQEHASDLIKACNLILIFVLSYVLKVIFLGREDKSNWANFYLIVLYTHEALIALMLIFGVRARLLARKFAATLLDPEPTPEIIKLRKSHAKAGKLCLGSALCALVTAAVILFGMWARA